MTEGHVTVEDSRLSSLETKMDKVIERLDTLVRLEERHDGAVKRIDRHDDRLDRHASRIAQLEADAAVKLKSSSWIERFVWTVIAAAVGTAAYFVRG